MCFCKLVFAEVYCVGVLGAGNKGTLAHVHFIPFLLPQACSTPPHLWRSSSLALAGTNSSRPTTTPPLMMPTWAAMTNSTLPRMVECCGLCQRHRAHPCCRPLQDVLPAAPGAHQAYLICHVHVLGRAWTCAVTKMPAVCECARSPAIRLLSTYFSICSLQPFVLARPGKSSFPRSLEVVQEHRVCSCMLRRLASLTSGERWGTQACTCKPRPRGR